ncbi:urotensin-2 isoform X1 [Monodelphis domestica]|uniref:urotensin-2 isoform X1 n=1 Tax=Monodelphis domestica TaxID=13616 RepID=UPI0024E214C0|nr:urotensin-2 isoform X1 [Monodelphis domestica]
MYKLIFSWVFFVGFLSPLLSLPVIDSSEMVYRLSADDEDTRLMLEDLGRASILKTLPEILDAEREKDSRKFDLSSAVLDQKENGKKAFYEKDPKISLLGHLLAGTRKQFKKRGPPSECFWKYCV